MFPLQLGDTSNNTASNLQEVEGRNQGRHHACPSNWLPRVKFVLDIPFHRTLSPLERAVNKSSTLASPRVRAFILDQALISRISRVFRKNILSICSMSSRGSAVPSSMSFNFRIPSRLASTVVNG
jgi:hypothetical protein